MKLNAGLSGTRLKLHKLLELFTLILKKYYFKKKGFICADITKYSDLLKYGSEKAVKEDGK
jgi:hypothetical protein